MRVSWWEINDPEVEQRWLTMLVRKYILPRKGKKYYGITITLGGDFAEQIKSSDPQHYAENQAYIEKYNRRFAQACIKAPQGERILDYVDWLREKIFLEMPGVPVTFSLCRPMSEAQYAAEECIVDIYVEYGAVIEMDDQPVEVGVLEGEIA